MTPDAYLEMARTEDRHWWFAGRRAILSATIRQLDLPADCSILEVGTGTGGNLAMLTEVAHVSGMESDAAARSIAMQKTEGRFDIRAGSFPDCVPFAQERFDLICFFDVLEHIEADVESLALAKELLTTGGRMIVTVPAYRWLWSAHDEHLHHKRRYSASELAATARAAGLQVVRVSHFNTLLFPLAAIARLGRNARPSGTDIPREPINRIFTSVLGAERFLLKVFDLPFGLSLLAVLSADWQLDPSLAAEGGGRCPTNSGRHR